MKKLSTYLFLILFSFQASSLADDIRDFQIEGISLGDSMLDYASRERIIKEKEDGFIYPNKKFYMGVFYPEVFKKKFEIYEFVQIHLKNYDDKFHIYSLQGIISYRDDIKGCLKKKKEIYTELKDLFKISGKNFGKTKHTVDPSGQSFFYDTVFKVNEGVVVVTCYHWSKRMEEEKGWWTNLKVIIDSKEFDDWLVHDAYTN